MKKLLIITFLLLLISTRNNNTVNAAIEEPVTGISVDFDDIKPTFIWTTDKVNLRSEASINSDIITTLDKRTKLLKAQMITSSDKWIKVICDGEIGYVNSDYVTDKELFTSNKNRWKTDLTEDEIDIFAKILWLECRGEVLKGKIACAETIMNRIYHKAFSDTLLEVLSDENQFATWDNRNEAKPSKEEYEVVKKVLNNETNVVSMNVVYFSTTPYNNKVEIKIGGHYFCEY